MRHLLVLVALSGTASVVAAEPAPEVDLDVRPTPSGPPQIEATIIGAPRVPASAISLRDEHGIGADRSTRAHRRVDATGNHGFSALEQRLAAGDVAT